MKDIKYWKENAEEDYRTTPISVLKYITKLESLVNDRNSKILNWWSKTRDEVFSEHMERFKSLKPVHIPQCDNENPMSYDIEEARKMMLKPYRCIGCRGVLSATDEQRATGFIIGNPNIGQNQVTAVCTCPEPFLTHEDWYKYLDKMTDGKTI